jgi:hypothetical protein
VEPVVVRGISRHHPGRPNHHFTPVRLLIAGFLAAEQEIVSRAFSQPLQFTDEQGWAAAIIAPLGSQLTP